MSALKIQLIKYDEFQYKLRWVFPTLKPIDIECKIKQKIELMMYLDVTRDLSIMQKLFHNIC